MSKVQSPYGLRPVKKLGDSTRSGSVNHYPLTVNATANICQGDLVAIVNGSVAAVAANPVAGTLSANTPTGVFVGAQYEDAFAPRFRPVLPANLISSGIASADVEVVDDERTVFSVQANGSVPATALGSNISLGGFANSDVANKTSRLYADVATLEKSSTSTHPFRIVGFDTTSGNVAGDAFTQILVRFNTGAHANTLAGTQ